MTVEIVFTTRHPRRMILAGFSRAPDGATGRGFAALVVWLVLVLPSGGCTTSKIDWNKYIGIYTYDNAVEDLGPPVKTEKLLNGTILADWVTNSGSTTKVPMAGAIGRSPHSPPLYSYPQTSSPSYGAYSTVKSPTYLIRLIFGPDGKLQSWERMTR